MDGVLLEIKEIIPSQRCELINFNFSGKFLNYQKNESFYRDVYQSFNPSVNATEAAVLEFNTYNSITLQHDSYLCTAVDLRNKKAYIGKMFPINFTFV